MPYPAAFCGWAAGLTAPCSATLRASFLLKTLYPCLSMVSRLDHWLLIAVPRAMRTAALPIGDHLANQPRTRWRT